MDKKEMVSCDLTAYINGIFEGDARRLKEWLLKELEEDKKNNKAR